MKLLLDEMYWPAVAEQLVARGHDVSAAIVRSDLSNLADPQLFAAAQQEERAVVTENVGDFIPLARDYAAAGAPHHGLILVAPSAFPRDRANKDATIGRIVTALDALLERRPENDADSLVVWLQGP